jgi:hypothetical protein
VEPAREAAAQTQKGPVVFKLHGCRVEVLSLSPLIVEVENLLTSDMVKNLLACVEKGKWLRSKTTNENGREGLDDNRTSSTMSADSVLHPGALASILHRVARFTGFNFDAVERPVTIVRYDTGQFYGPHHDAGTVMNSDGTPCGVPDSSTSPDDLVVAIPDVFGEDPAVRILSLFAYLNEHEAGTEFTLLGRRGCSLKFPPLAKVGQPKSQNSKF